MINRVVLVGRLTKDVDLKKTQSDTSVASFTVACNRRFSGQNQGQQQADFISCVAWRQTADFLHQYAKKGSLVGVEGRIQTRSYDDASGKRVYVTEVVCDSCQLLESKQSSESRSSSTSSYNQQGYQQAANQGYQPDNSFDDFGSSPALDISSDDLPF